MPSLTITEVAVQVTVGVLLTAILLDDLKNYRIRNTTVLTLVGLFVVWCLIKGDLSLFVSHMAVAAVLFVIFSVMYHFGMMGGGDVKLMTSAFLWHGLEHGSVFAILLCLSSLSYVAIAHFHLLPSRKRDSRVSVPFGPSISAAWLATVLITQLPITQV